MTLTAAERTTPTWDHRAAIAVYGTPAGQGAVTFLGKGRGARHTNAKTLKPWRQAIIDATRTTTGCHGYTDRGGTCLICQTLKSDHGLYAHIPTAVEITVTVPKPKSAPKRRQSWPITRASSDIDHHARACLDALTMAGLIRDDAQVTDLAIRKVYPAEHPDALSEPGALIRLYTLTGAPE